MFHVIGLSSARQPLGREASPTPLVTARWRGWSFTAFFAAVSLTTQIFLELRNYGALSSFHASSPWCTMALYNRAPHFPAFIDLPFELRRQVWAIGLAEQLDRLYQFRLKQSKEDEPPPLCLVMSPETFNQATALTRRFLATCRESRQVTMELLPQALHVRARPRESKDDHDNRTRVLRFNGSRDYIEVLFMTDHRLQEAISNGPCRRFSGIRNLSLGPDGVGILVRMFGNGVGLCPGRCQGPECADACQLHPIPRLMRMFPDLTTLCIQVSALENPNPCSCLDEDGSPVTHDWPTLKTTDPRWSHCVIRKEGACRTYVPSREFQIMKRRYSQLPNYRGQPDISFPCLRVVQARPE